MSNYPYTHEKGSLVYKKKIIYFAFVEYMRLK